MLPNNSWQPKSWTTFTSIFISSCSLPACMKLLKMQRMPPPRISRTQTLCLEEKLQFLDVNLNFLSLLRERNYPSRSANLINLASTDFKGNLGKIIHDIYQTDWHMFNDMGEVDHKKGQNIVLQRILWWDFFLALWKRKMKTWLKRKR